MFRDDFILRHIRLFVQAIAKALGLIKEGDLGFALETVRVSFSDLLGMSLDDFLAYPDDRVKDFLYFGELGPMGLNRTAFAAGMLAIAGRIHAAQDRPELSQACFEKALRVLLETVLGEEEEIEIPEFAPPIDEILEAVPVQSLNDDLLTMVAFHFDRTGQIRRAEEAIRVLFERNPDEPDIRDTVRSFYEYLLDLDETDLRASGVEVEAARDLCIRLQSRRSHGCSDNNP